MPEPLDNHDWSYRATTRAGSHSHLVRPSGRRGNLEGVDAAGQHVDRVHVNEGLHPPDWWEAKRDDICLHCLAALGAEVPA